MMMEQPAAKPATLEENPTTTVTKSAPPTNASAEERVNDLERRLNNLGGGEKNATPSAASSAPVSSANSSSQAKNNPLLQRIMAAQERARQAEQKEKEAKAAAQAEVDRKRLEEEEAVEKQEREEEERIQKAHSALRVAAGNALEEKQNEILRELEGKPMVVPQEPTNQAAAVAAPERVAVQQQKQPLQAVQPAVPIMKSLDPPPPFESMKFPPPKILKQDEDGMVGHGMNSRVLTQQKSPPSFDMVQRQNVDAPPPAPSAPDLSHFAPAEHHLEGVLPVAPPFAQAPSQAQMPPPPSFDTVEQQMQQHEQLQSGNLKTPEEDYIDFDIDGNPLTPEQREAMIEEQRKLYENIMKEKAENDAAIAKATADAFDSRSANAAVKAMDTHSSQTHSMDSAGRNITGEEESKEAETAVERREARRMVKIGNNQTVALHGQGRTKKAIKDGTAILVQCINCQNWMQVTGTATLMFCPVCQVVSPVIKQSEVLTKEEAIQLTMDRKLAEKLQAEAYDHDGSNETKEEAKDEGYFSNLFGSSSSNAAAVKSSSVTSTDSWWDKISNIVSYGVTETEEPRERGELGVTLPPGSSSISTYPGERRGTLSPALTDDGGRGEETQGLLRPVIDGNEANLPAARVAEQKPLFSCVADSVSSAASALFSNAEGEEDEEGNIYGVDASSLLVTSAGREGGEYSRLPNNE